MLNYISGDHLRRLLLIGCPDVDPVLEFSRFDHLEILGLQKSTMVLIRNATELSLRVPPTILANCGQFLPNLKTLTTAGTCLGHWSRLFECRRPWLTAFHFSCCHIGLPSMSEFNWTDAPQLWPNLRRLTLLNLGRQTTEMLKQVVPQLNNFRKFQEFVIPPRTEDLIAEIGVQSLTGIHVQYLSDDFFGRCVYWQND